MTTRVYKLTTQQCTTYSESTTELAGYIVTHRCDEYGGHRLVVQSRKTSVASPLQAVILRVHHLIFMARRSDSIVVSMDCCDETQAKVLEQEFLLNGAAGERKRQIVSLKTIFDEVRARVKV